MNCRQAQALIDDTIDGLLAADQAQELDAHLDGCSACRAEVVALRCTVALVAALPERQPARGFDEAVMAQIAPSPVPVWRWAAAIVAGLLIMALPAWAYAWPTIAGLMDSAAEWVGVMVDGLMVAAAACAWLLSGPVWWAVAVDVGALLLVVWLARSPLRAAFVNGRMA